ncbi:MAG: DUF4058 family protein [Caldilineaceae bacterium]
MPSPFPGMDPYIEDPEIWNDFHSDLAAEMRAELNRQIQPRYVARIIPRVTYELVGIDERRSVRPDVGVWQPAQPSGEIAPVATLITPAPVENAVVMESPLRLHSVEILEVATLRLVTAIEILSPVNKRLSHDAYEEYQRKRRELLRSQAHLLEIDLLRGGTRPPLAYPITPAAYYIMLSRVALRPRVQVWPIRLQDALPVLPVPLLEPDPDAALDLGGLVAAIYERGGYAMLIDYRQPPPPPALVKEDSLWLGQLLQAYRNG